MNNHSFQLLHTDSHSGARAGILRTSHGTIETPIFMPVGTVASVKSVLQEHLVSVIQSQIILANAYHLFLRPGLETLFKAGGVHKFMNFPKSMLTDSGGYQVFSLATIRKIQDDGILFSSHIDGSKHFFTPEKVMQIQKIIGADIMMPLDICIENNGDKDATRKAMLTTIEWLKKSVQELKNIPNKYTYENMLFPIVQGGVFSDLRKESCLRTIEIQSEGYAIGGLSVGEEESVLYDMCGVCCQYLPKDKPRYLMGVGMPHNILNAIELGVDMFDCVIPTRNGRNGMLFTTQGIINIKNKKWEHDFSSIDNGMENIFSKSYSKAYLRHLFVANELLAYQIASLQNLSFYIWLTKEARKNIINNTFVIWKKNTLEKIQKRL